MSYVYLFPCSVDCYVAHITIDSAENREALYDLELDLETYALRHEEALA